MPAKTRSVERISPALELESVLLPMDEAAARVGQTRVTLYREINEGRLKTVMVGSRRFVTLKQLADWIALMAAKPAPLPKQCANNRFRKRAKQSKQHSQRAVA